MRFVKILLALFLGLGLIGTSIAQEQTSEIIGTVTDDSGAPLPGVSVEAVSPSLVGKATVFTDVSGRYRIPALPSGTYKLSYTLEGFTTVVRENIQLRVGQILTVNVSMKMTTIAETITVTAAVPLIDVKRSATSTNITKEMFQRLPKGRSFTSIVTLAPSVNEEGWLGGISVDGASGSENMFYVDGTDITDQFDGDNTLNVVFEHLEEIQVKQSGYEAEFGGSTGGVINVITRSGGNEYHGDLTFYYSGSSTDGSPRDVLRINPFDNTKAEFINYGEKADPGVWHNYEVGLNLGGYIMKDKLWFFGGFLPTYRTYDRTVTFLDTQKTMTVQGTRWWPRIQAKLTAQPFEKLRLSASFVNDLYKWKGELPPSDGSGSSTYQWEEAGRTTPDMTFNLRGDFIPSPSVIASFNAGYYYTNKGINQLLKPTEPRWFFNTSNSGMGIPNEYVRPRNWYNYSYNAGYYTEKYIQTRISAGADVTYYFDLAGEHSAKAGVLFARLDDDLNDAYLYDYIRFYWGRTFYDPEGNPHKGKYGYYEVRSPFGTLAKAHSLRWAIYAQDSWTIARKLTLNFGLRAEREYIPSFGSAEQHLSLGLPATFYFIKFNFDDKLAPRIGFSYDVFGDSSLKVFGNFGIYYDVMKLEMAEGSFGGFKWVSHYYTLDTYEWNKIGGKQQIPFNKDAPYYPGKYIMSLDWRIPSFESVQPDIKPMAQSEVSLGFEKKLMENLSLRVRGVYKHLIRTIEDVGVMTPLGEAYFTANPGADWVNKQYDPSYWKCPKAKRDYTALDISLEKRFSNNWMGGASYTLSKLYGNYAGLASSDEYGRQDPNVERYFDLFFMSYTQDGKLADGLLNTDRTHQFKLWGSYSFDFGLTVGLNALAMSGTPLQTEFLMNNIQGYYPLGRTKWLESLGGKVVSKRTPFITRTDLYAEYNYKIGGKYTLQFNVNVTNVLDLKTARNVWRLINQENVYLDDSEILKTFDFQKVIKDNNLQLDPRYGMKYDFMGPISVRLGVKFLF
ncbi:MAG: TonB-dependent receptor [Candidatus Aminicenantia bacterium]